MRTLRGIEYVASSALCALLAGTAHAHSGPLDLQQVLMKTAANYRAAQTMRVSTEWTRTLGEKQYRATVAVAAKRPNLFRLSARGAYFDTEIACDGRELTALRMLRQVFTQKQAPKQLIGADVLAGVTLPAPATRLITVLLQGRWQDRTDPLIGRLYAGTLSGPQGFGDALAYVITFDYDADYTARVYITQDDWLVRRVALYRKGTPEIVETVTAVSFDTKLDDSVFRLELPSGSIKARVLPAPEEPAVPIPMATETVDGRRITFSDLRGRVILLTFFFTSCPYCNDEVVQLQSVYDRLKQLGLEVIAVNGTGESRDEVKRWAQERGLTFPVALNKTPTDLVAMFGVRAYPTNVVFNREGKVIYKGEGFEPDRLFKALSEEGIR